MEGPLLKLSASRCAEWRERWFELRNNMLLYYKEVGDAQACGVVPLHDCEVTTLLGGGVGGGGSGGGSGIASAGSGCWGIPEKGEEGSTYAYAGLSADQLKKCFKIYHPQRRTYFLMAKNERKMKHWVSRIRAAMIGDNYSGDEGAADHSYNNNSRKGSVADSPTNYSNNKNAGDGRRKESARGSSGNLASEGGGGDYILSAKKKKRIHRRKSFVLTLKDKTLEGFMRCRCFPPPPPAAEFLSKFKMEVEIRDVVLPKAPTRKNSRKGRATNALTKANDAHGGYDLGQSQGKRQTWYFILRNNVLYILQDKMVTHPSSFYLSLLLCCIFL